MKEQTVLEWLVGDLEDFGINQKNVKPESRIVEDLGLDSLDAVELLMSIEDHFNIEITDEEMENIKTVQDVINLISKDKR